MKPPSNIPKLLIDIGEKIPLVFENLLSKEATLPTGDYSLEGSNDLLVEPKSISDLIGSLTSGRERFSRELDRMAAASTQVLLIVGENSNQTPQTTIERHDYRSQTKPHVTFASLASIEARGISIRWARTPQEASRIVERLAWYSWRNRLRSVNLTPPKTPPAILEGITMGL